MPSTKGSISPPGVAGETMLTSIDGGGGVSERADIPTPGSAREPVLASQARFVLALIAADLRSEIFLNRSSKMSELSARSTGLHQ